jgi:hypothetical protein
LANSLASNFASVISSGSSQLGPAAQKRSSTSGKITVRRHSNADRAATLASVDRFKKIAANLRAAVIIQHDLDMMFRGDECRIRADHAPANFITIKHMALNLIRRASGKRFPAPPPQSRRLFTRFPWENPPFRPWPGPV